MTEINYWDSWQVARQKINEILDIAENSIPSIWENNHWYLWWNDTWINVTWPQWEQWIQWEQGIQWPKWDKWDKWEQWPQWEKWDQWERWPKWEQWIQWPKWDTWSEWPQWVQWPKWDKWSQWIQWEQWPEWPQGSQWPQGKTWPTWASIVSWAFDWNDLVFTKDDSNTVVIEWAKTTLTWPQWPEWPEWPTWPAWTYTAWQWIDITNDKISTTFIYWESSTAAATVQKEVSIPSITELNVWQVIIVKPTVTSTVANSTLKLNNFDAYGMLYNGNAITTSTDSIVWGANVPSMFILDEVSGTRYWRFLGHWLDNNTTYALNYTYDYGNYTAGVWKYAITRYSIVMQKLDWTWEKITDTSVTYSSWTSKNVNTNWFILNQIRYYWRTATIANGALVDNNAFYQKTTIVDMRYSTNCGNTPAWSQWDFLYLVGTIGNDWLFYLDTTQWWSNSLPAANDGKLYIRIWLVQADSSYKISFFFDRPIFYHNWTKICDYINEASEIIYKRPTTWNYTLQSSDWVLSWVAI